MTKKNKKTIIFSSYDDLHNPYYAGGGARAIHEVAKLLAAHYNVVVYTGNYPDAKETVVDSVHYKRLGPAHLGPKLGQLLFHLILPFIVKKESFDVWIESFTPPFSTTALQKYTSRPVIGLAHMLSSEDMRRKYKLPFHLIEHLGLPTYNNFITITPQTKYAISKHNKNANFFVIPNGVELRNSHPVNNKTDNYILFLGRIEVDQKGLDLLLDSYAQITDKTTTKLIIAGSGTKQEVDMLKKIIQEKHLEEYVELKGRVEGKIKDDLLRNATMIVVPSRYETFGNVVLEAMAFNKPLIGFAINGLEWVPDECMIKVKKFDTKQMAKQLLTALRDKKKLLKMQKSAQQAVKKYSWQITATAYKQAIESII